MKIRILLLALFVFTPTAYAQTFNDSTLARVIAKDKRSRNSSGQIILLPASEHFFRADVYMSNRQFPQAREHWQKILSAYPQDPNIPKALFGMGRSNMWERKYTTAIFWFNKLTKNHASTFHGREGLAYMGACYVRLQKNLKAAETYSRYTVMYPYGKRIASSFLNIIDAYREAGRYRDANNVGRQDKETFFIVNGGNERPPRTAENGSLSSKLERSSHRVPPVEGSR